MNNFPLSTMDTTVPARVTALNRIVEVQQHGGCRTTGVRVSQRIAEARYRSEARSSERMGRQHGGDTTATGIRVSESVATPNGGCETAMEVPVTERVLPGRSRSSSSSWQCGTATILRESDKAEDPVAAYR